MKDTALYEQLLGLKSPWSVKKVDLSLADQRVVVEVVLKKGQVWSDPTDATKRAHVNGWSERQWRHLDTCQFETLIKARVPQLKYSDGTRTCVNGKWSNPSGGSSSGSSSQTTKRAVKLQNCAGENEIQCRVLFSDGSVGYWTTRTSGQVVDVWEYFWGGGRWCVRLYENGGIQKLLC